MWLLFALACAGTPDTPDTSPQDTDGVETDVDTEPPDSDTSVDTDTSSDTDTSTDTDVDVDGWQPPTCAEEPCGQLSDWALFTDLAAATPADGVVPFDVNSPLWSDAAHKQRFIALPAGEHATWSSTTTLEFPRGTVLVKTFAFPRADGSGLDRVETRLLVNGAAGWKGRVYRWQGDDAVWFASGETVDVTWLDGATVRTDPYVVPDETMCDACHSASFTVSPIGPTANQLVRGDQIERLFAAGVFAAAPDTSTVVPLVDPTDTTATVDARARSWLHANCAHCHRSGGIAQFTQFFVPVEETDPGKLGVCKRPNQGDAGTGLTFDVVPGHPEQSFVVARIASTNPLVKMPGEPNLRADAVGVDVVTQWIAAMPESTCN